MKEGWTYKKLGEVCRINSGKSIKASFIQAKKADNLIPCYGGNGLRGYVESANCSGNNPIIGRVGAQCGNVHFSDGPFYATEHALVVSNISKEIDPIWLCHLFVMMNLKQYAEGAAQPVIAASRLLNLEISYPPLSEQRAIVARLDSAFAQIDSLKANAEKQLSEARKLFQKALEEAMTPKEGWEVKTLGELATDMYRGSGIRRDQITKEGIPCVRYGEIYTTYNVAFDECVSHTKEESISSPKFFEYGDLLFAITGESVEDIGKTIAYLGHKKCLLGGDIICMKHNQDAKFLSYALATPNSIRQKGIGKTKLKVVHTNAPALKAITVPLPSIEVQHSIVAHLDALSSHVRALEEKLKKMKDECDALKQAMLREVFE